MLPHNIEKLSNLHAHVYYNMLVAITITSDRIKIAQYRGEGVIFPNTRKSNDVQVSSRNYGSLPLCGESKRLQQRWQDLRSDDMAASEDGGGAAVAERGVNIALCTLEGSSIPEQGKECFSARCQRRQ